MTDRNGRRLGETRGPQLVQRASEVNASMARMSGALPGFLSHELTDELRLVFRRANVSPDLIYAFSKTGRIVTEENRIHLSAAQHREWKQALREYRQRAEADSRAVALCYDLHHESGHSDLSNKKRFVASELGVAVLNALEEEISSFAMEGVFLNAWLTLVFNRIRLLAEAAEMLRQQFGADMAEIRGLLNGIYDDLPNPSWSSAIERRIARIEAVRAVPESWLGKPPASREEAEWEMTPAFEHLESALSFCEAASIPQDVMESMFLRFWVRTRVLNDRLPELFFQVLDKNWKLVHARVQSHMARYSGPRLQ